MNQVRDRGLWVKREAGIESTDKLIQQSEEGEATFFLFCFFLNCAFQEKQSHSDFHFYNV